MRSRSVRSERSSAACARISRLSGSSRKIRMAGLTDFYLTNKPIGDDYNTFEFGVSKRMSEHWQVSGGFDWVQRNLASLFSEDPNIVYWNSTNTQTTGWTLKASGSYLFGKGVMVAV